MLDCRNFYYMTAKKSLNYSAINIIKLLKIYVVAYQFHLIFAQKSIFEV